MIAVLTLSFKHRMNIKFLGYARYSTATLIFDVNQESSNRELAKDSESVS